MARRLICFFFLLNATAVHGTRKFKSSSRCCMVLWWQCVSTVTRIMRWTFEIINKMQIENRRRNKKKFKNRRKYFFFWNKRIAFKTNYWHGKTRIGCFRKTKPSYARRRCIGGNNTKPTLLWHVGFHFLFFLLTLFVLFESNRASVAWRVNRHQVL